MKTFEFDGDQYEKASRHQKEWGGKLLAQLRLKGSETILDLGCGDGALTEQLSLLVPAGRVLGIDASAGMIQKAAEHRRDNLRFIQMDIRRMNFENEFDVILSNAALHWVKDHVRLLGQAQRALKSGGVILWNFAGEGNCSNFFSVMREKLAEARYAPYFSGFEWPWYMPAIAEYRALAETAGFSEYCVQEENADRYFLNAEEMVRWIDQPSLVPFIGHVPENMQAAFRSEVIAEMLRRTRQADGTCFETFRRISFTAQKA